MPVLAGSETGIGLTPVTTRLGKLAIVSASSGKAWRPVIDKGLAGAKRNLRQDLGVKTADNLQPEQFQILDSRETEIPSSFKTFPGHVLKAEMVQLHRSKPNQSVG